MLKKIALSTFAILLSAFCISAQIEAPKLSPVPSTENQQRLIMQGIVLHDNKDYEGAIRKYEEALSENSDSVEAIWEMCLSYSAKGDHQKSLELAYRGARYKSRLLTAFYTTAANCLDDIGDSKRAIEFYDAAIKPSCLRFYA